MRLRILVILSAGSLSLLPPSTSLAQTQRSGGGPSQAIMQQYQQLAAEKTALQTQLEQAKKDLDAAKTELAAVKKERDAAKAHVGVSPAALAQANSAKEAAEHNAEKAKQQIGDLVVRFREMATNLRDVEGDRNKLKDELVKGNAAFDRCAEDNSQLYEITGQVLDRYEHVGLFTKASSIEPFTKITRTRIENLADEYRERAQLLRVKKQAQQQISSQAPPQKSAPGPGSQPTPAAAPSQPPAPTSPPSAPRN
jgi:chromosome segregation ATPase